ncbi:PAS domain S-box protein [Sediminibacterium goheungense]|uniref:Sensory/regulatory protein RpfC n=1 Tax=Sediminibacterium goheungense TaxID=1086393 RepID=A0A4R6J238_9BACT|nr:PAS domain S-box protein [Sediminibacterium goheungense]TDO29283.1 PAS domain S-box-containing protein [Sediminibacterium goheungense]
MSNFPKSKTPKMYGRVRWLFFFSVLTLIFLGGVLYQQQKDLSKASYWLNHTYSILKEVSQLKSSVARAESSTRNYILSKDTSWKQYIVKIQAESQLYLTQLAERIKNDTAFSTDQLASVKELIHNKSEFQKAVLEGRQSHEEIMERMEYRGEGAIYSQAIYKILDSMTVIGERLLIRRATANERSSSSIGYTSLIGGIIAFIVVLILIIQLNRDLALRKKAEESVGYSDEKYRNIIENASVVMYTTDENGTITFANKQVGDLTGYTVEELIGKDFSFLLHPSWLQQVFNHYTNQFQQRIPSTTLEFITRTKSGQQKWVEQTAQLLIKDDLVLGYQCMVKDITEKKRIELELKEAEQRSKENQLRLEAILENTTSLIFIKNLDGRYIMVNRRFKEMMGVTDEMVIDKTDYDFSEKEAADHYKRLDDEVISTRKPVEAEEWIYGTEGRKNLLVIKFPLIDHRRKIFGIGGIATDITDRVLYQQKLIEARKNAEEAKYLQEQFLANMSHEIRTPMNGIQGMTNLLLQTELNSQQKEFTGMIKRSVNNLLVIVNDILDFSKIKAGRLTIDKTSFSIREVLNNIRAQFEHEAARKELQLIIECEPSLPETIIGDPYRLNQILVNIVGNAVKFTVSGEVRIKVEQVNQEGSKANFLFTVTDTGIGIPEDKTTVIFDAFTQAGPDIARNYGGAGLGLAICKGLVEIQQGSIAVANIPGGGSVFSVSIPYDILEQEITQEPEDESLLLKGKKFLVVEDNEVNQKLVSYVLKKVGGTVDIAHNGRMAIDLLENKNANYDLIIMDIQMPVMDGYEATEYIRTVLKLQTPIIAMTATALKGDQERSEQVGMNEFMLKPFDFNHLYKRLVKLLSTRKESITENTDNMNGEKLYDLSLLEGLDDKDSLLDVLNLFMENTPNQIRELIALGNTDQYDEMYKLAHKLKGALAMLQASRISELLGTIEANARERTETDRIRDKIGEVSRLFDQMQKQLTEEKEQIMGR